MYKIHVRGHDLNITKYPGKSLIVPEESSEPPEVRDSPRFGSCDIMSWEFKVGFLKIINGPAKIGAGTDQRGFDI